jgi:hypothetical protein
MPISGARPIRPAYVESGQGIPPVKHYTIANAQSLKIGTPVTLSSGLAAEIANDATTNILGVAQGKSESAYGYDIGDSPLVVTGRADTTPVALNSRNTVFVGQLSNGTTALVTPSTSNVGVAYGLQKQTDGAWTVDTSDTTNIVVRVIGFDLSEGGPNGVVFFKFIASTALI